MTLPARIRREPRLGVPERIRCPAHLKWVREHACCVAGCNGRPIEAHHILKTNMARGLKPSDARALSLCLAHHREAHDYGETRFETKYGIAMLEKAAEFASKSPHRRKLLPPTPERR